MKEKTENTSLNAFDTKKKSEVKTEVKKEIKEAVKESVPEVNVEANKNVQDINAMSDAEIEAYLKKRKAEHDAFTITSVKVPMSKLVQASVAPAPKMNQADFVRNMTYLQNKLMGEVNKKG